MFSIPLFFSERYRSHNSFQPSKLEVSKLFSISEGVPLRFENSNIFSENEIKMIQELYYSLPERTFNKKQNVRKKAWLQNYNKELEIFKNRI